MKCRGVSRFSAAPYFLAAIFIAIFSGTAFGEPVGSIVINNNALYTKSSSVILSLPATDPSGISQMCISNTADCSSWIKYKKKMKWTLPAGDGMKTVYAFFRNKEGVANTNAYSASITLDSNPPEGSLTATPAEFQIALNWSDFSDSVSGIAGYTLVFSSKKAPVKCGKQGVLYTGTNTSFVHSNLDARKTYYYLVCATDAAGNISTAAKASANPVDTVPPVGTVAISIPSSKKPFSAILALSATDPSGVSQMCISNAGTCSDWIKYKKNMKWTLPAGDGLKTVNVWFKDGVGNVNVTPYSDSVVIGSNVVTPADIQNAKDLVADLRNTTLSIYNYRGTGVPGIFDTPFVNLTDEINNTIEPELMNTLRRIEWIIDSVSDVSPGTTLSIPFYQDSVMYTLAITVSADNTQADFTITDEQEVQTDSGHLVVDNGTQPTSGTFTAAMKSTSGELVAALTFSAAVANGSYTSMNFTGSLTAPGLSFDFSQEGRGLSGTFERIPGKSDPNDIFPTSIHYSGTVITNTVQLTGSLNSTSIVWNPFAEDPMPENVTFEGSFAELQNGTPTGVLFTGTVQGSWDNADTYNTQVGLSPTNYPRWNASFEGEIDAPSRPVITASLAASQETYNTLNLSIGYTDGTSEYLEGTGVLYLDTDVLTGTLNNQDGLKVIFSFYSDKSGDEQFQGQITTAGGLKLADLYTLSQIPLVRYVDGYVESVF